MNLWTKEEIYKILIQLDRMKLPFKNYSFVQENGKLKLLGSGGSAECILVCTVPTYLHYMYWNPEISNDLQAHTA